MQEQSEEQVNRSKVNFEDLLRESVNNAGLNKRRSLDSNISTEISNEIPNSNSEMESTSEHVNEAISDVKDKPRKHNMDVTEEKSQNLNKSDDNSERTSNPRGCVSVIGAILRIMGDEQYCRTCGKHLRFMGDEIYCMYAAKRMMSPLLLELAASDTMYY